MMQYLCIVLKEKKISQHGCQQLKVVIFYQCPPYARKQEVFKSVMAASAVREVHSPLNSLMKGLFSQAVSLIRFG